MRAGPAGTLVVPRSRKRRRTAIRREWLEALRRHGVRFVIYRGDIYYEDGEIWKVVRLCREGKLPDGLC